MEAEIEAEISRLESEVGIDVDMENDRPKLDLAALTRIAAFAQQRLGQEYDVRFAKGSQRLNMRTDNKVTVKFILAHPDGNGGVLLDD